MNDWKEKRKYSVDCQTFSSIGKSDFFLLLARLAKISDDVKKLRYLIGLQRE